MNKVVLIIAIIMVAVMIATIFVGCSAESYQKQLEKKGYTVMVIDSNSAERPFGVYSDSIEYIVRGIKDDSIMVIYAKFESNKDAKRFEKEYRKNLDSNTDSYTSKIQRTGKIVKITIKEKVDKGFIFYS